MPGVAFVTTDFNNNIQPPEPNGCAWYRMVLPARELEELGWETVVGQPRLATDYGVGVAYKDGMLTGYDATVTKLIMHKAFPEMIPIMRARGERVIVDVDDFHYGLEPTNIAYHSTHPHTDPNSNRMWYEIGIRAADRVIVSTEFLADHYSRRVRDVCLVRNSIDVDRYTPMVQNGEAVFGWVGGTLWRSGDIELLRDWLPGFSKDHGIRVHHAGHISGDGKHFGVRAGLKKVSTQNMTSIVEYPKLFTEFNVGLVPLTMNPFNEAKSFLKGLEYAASGIPFIASPTREYELLHEAGVGRLAETPDEWRDHATELLNPDVRAGEANRQRLIVESLFNIKGKGNEWATAILG